ncbi:hypothetical protein [uncultured Demequina sp.]|uniref:hypothetical protein n=1 Tax=uncultured Demequina sp. TaxID=693499 RepID=UPI0025CBB2FB|nr:hypothetical protein [uncultured Demequina sp.]
MADAPPVPAEVEDAISGYPDEVQDRILELRALVWDVVRDSEDIGAVREALKWGQPSILPVRPRTGTTLRIDRIGSGSDVAILTHCQTSLVDEFRAEHGDLLEYDGTRAVIVPATGELPVEELRAHVRSALVYHRR